MAVSHVARVGAFRHDIDRRVAALVLAAALPGGIIGALVYARLDERAIALTLGIFMLAIVALSPRLRPAAPCGWGRAGSSPSFGFGLVSGGTIGGGILVLPILASAGLAGAALVATDAVIGLALHGVKMIVFGSVSVLTRELVLLGVIVGIMTMPGAWAARWLLDRIPLTVHAGIIDAVSPSAGSASCFRRDLLQACVRAPAASFAASDSAAWSAPGVATPCRRCRAPCRGPES